MSVVAPLCIVAGSYATIGMLMAAEAPALLRDAGLRYLGVGLDGRTTGTLPTSYSE